jgi:hypothetical protein
MFRKYGLGIKLLAGLEGDQKLLMKHYLTQTKLLELIIMTRGSDKKQPVSVFA